MHKTAPDTKRMAFAVQSLRHAKTPEYISSIVIFPFSVNPVQPGILSWLNLKKLVISSSIF